MAKMEVVSVRPIPGSNGRGYEVEVTTKNRRTSPKRRAEWRRQRIEEIVACAEQLDNVDLMHLKWFAEAFVKVTKKEGLPAGTSEAL
jgi:hypothetical protein